jgi:hypothetical protein
MRGPTTSSSTLPAILGYCITSNVMTLTNKFVLSSYEFHMNFFLLASQVFSFFSYILVASLRRCAVCIYELWIRYLPSHEQARYQKVVSSCIGTDCHDIYWIKGNSVPFYPHVPDLQKRHDYNHRVRRGYFLQRISGYERYARFFLDDGVFVGYCRYVLRN